jgi:hypothetical protein
MKIDELIRAATSHAESVKVSRTGINPLLWLVGLITPLALILAVWTNDALLRVGLLAFAALPPFVAIIGWFVLLFLRPQMLESEEYRLRQSAIRLLIDSAGDEKIVNAATQSARIESLLGGVGEGEGK